MSAADLALDRPEPLQAFLIAVGEALVADAPWRLVLARPRGGIDVPLRVDARALVVHGRRCCSFVHAHRTREQTLNLEPGPALEHLRELLQAGFAHARLDRPEATVELLTGKRGRRTLLRSRSTAEVPRAADPTLHDRVKQRWVDVAEPFLVELGVTTAEHRLVPAMARKWKQINKFVEVLAHAIDAAGLGAEARERPLQVLDFGSGKGYLTFALHAHLSRAGAGRAQVTGIDLRADLIALCNSAAQRLGLRGLNFEHGDVGSFATAAVDVMVALHACDTATDHAIHKGIRSGARVIVCAPCCHKELRPQLLSPHPLRPLLRHGVHLGQQAEMLTDTLRALLLEACGYETQVFEFVALEHTQKNKMILAVKRAGTCADPAAAASWTQLSDLKAFYGVRDQCLERLLRADAAG